MAKKRNECGIKTVVMNPAFNVICPVSQAPVRCKAKVEFYPDEYIPEFMEAQNALRQTLENKQFSMEAAAKAVLDYFASSEYSPKKVTVTVENIANNMYFPAQVAVEYAPGNASKPGGTESGETEDKKLKAKKSGFELTAAQKQNQPGAFCAPAPIKPFLKSVSARTFARQSSSLCFLALSAQRMLILVMSPIMCRASCSSVCHANAAPPPSKTLISFFSRDDQPKTAGSSRATLVMSAQ